MTMSTTLLLISLLLALLNDVRPLSLAQVCGTQWSVECIGITYDINLSDSLDCGISGGRRLLQVAGEWSWARWQSSRQCESSATGATRTACTVSRWQCSHSTTRLCQVADLLCLESWQSSGRWLDDDNLPLNVAPETRTDPVHTNSLAQSARPWMGVTRAVSLPLRTSLHQDDHDQDVYTADLSGMQARRSATISGQTAGSTRATTDPTRHRNDQALQDVRPGINLTTVCTTKWGRDTRHVTLAMRHAVFIRDKVLWAEHTKLIIDHRVPRELGGADTLSNLWVQSRAEARLKDREENRLHRAVCAGTILLSEAQERMRQWKTAEQPK